MKEIVLELDFSNENMKQQTLISVFAVSGICSCVLYPMDNKMVAKGDIDPASIVEKLRELGFVEKKGYKKNKTHMEVPPGEIVNVLPGEQIKPVAYYTMGGSSRSFSFSDTLHPNVDIHHTRPIVDECVTITISATDELHDNILGNKHKQVSSQKPHSASISKLQNEQVLASESESRSGLSEEAYTEAPPAEAISNSVPKLEPKSLTKIFDRITSEVDEPKGLSDQQVEVGMQNLYLKSGAEESTSCSEIHVLEPEMPILRGGGIEKVDYVEEAKVEAHYSDQPESSWNGDSTKEQFLVDILDSNNVADQSITITTFELYVDLKIDILHASLQHLQHPNWNFCDIDSDPKEYNCLFLVRNKFANLNIDRPSISIGDHPSPAALLRYQLLACAFTPQCLVYKGGSGSKELPVAEEWRKAYVVSLVETELDSLPVKPDAPRLVVLFVQGDRYFCDISPSFFDLMPALRFLDLSGVKISRLPSSLFTCTKLQVLLLRNCPRLRMLPPEIGNMHNMEVLDLLWSELLEVPDQLGQLAASLKQLHLSLLGPMTDYDCSYLPPEIIPHGVLSKFKALHALSIQVGPSDVRWRKIADRMTMEIVELKFLNHLQFYFPKTENLQDFVQKSPSWRNIRLRTFKFIVGNDIIRRSEIEHDGVEPKFVKFARCLRFINGHIFPQEIKEVIEHATYFCLEHHLHIRSLSQFGYSNMKQLKFCVVRECPTIVVIFGGCVEGETEAIMPNLEYLGINFHPKLLRIWSSVRMPNGSFSALKTLNVFACDALEVVIPLSVLSCLSSLEKLVVIDCISVTNITEEEKEMEDANENSNASVLPRLRKVELIYLPMLVTLGNGLCLTEEQLSVQGCPNLILIRPNLILNRPNVIIQNVKRRKLRGSLLGCFRGRGSSRPGV